MDFVNKLTGRDKNAEDTQSAEQQGSSGGGFMDKVNGMAGGGAQGEKNEDSLDKGTFCFSFTFVTFL